MTNDLKSPQPTAESGQPQHLKGCPCHYPHYMAQCSRQCPSCICAELEAVPAPPAESERVSDDGPKPLSESAKAAILEIQDRTEREVIIPHYGTYHEQKKALFSQIEITNELREHCEKTEKLLVETQAKLAALVNPVERVSMSTGKEDFDAIVQRVLITPIGGQIGHKCGTQRAMGFSDGWGFAIKRFKEEFAAQAALLKPQGETPSVQPACKHCGLPIRETHMGRWRNEWEHVDTGMSYCANHKEVAWPVRGETPEGGNACQQTVDTDKLRAEGILCGTIIAASLPPSEPVSPQPQKVEKFADDIRRQMKETRAGINQGVRPSGKRFSVSESPLPGREAQEKGNKEAVGLPPFDKQYELDMVTYANMPCGITEDLMLKAQIRSRERQLSMFMNPYLPHQPQGERTIVGLADDLAEALDAVLAAIPKQTEDADWWQDDLSTAVREANKLLAEYTAFPDAPQLPVRPEAE